MSRRISEDNSESKGTVIDIFSKISLSADFFKFLSSVNVGLT